MAAEGVQVAKGRSIGVAAVIPGVPSEGQHIEGIATVSSQRDREGCSLRKKAGSDGA